MGLSSVLEPVRYQEVHDVECLSPETADQSNADRTLGTATNDKPSNGADKIVAETKSKQISAKPKISTMSKAVSFGIVETTKMEHFKIDIKMLDANRLRIEKCSLHA
ncbi:uncharacterized protein LOC115759492 isoform X2 [Drosophila novamexicana]|uniref:uncharacterized protein LOC115759492 isoform X2 n=1 Tax=Drosophila novamexicana TaxID=47314 RepID=UPI0011E5C04F|nr:uncharacterized protein LOC115759492 isoform X2 [Drosophila novamexicana]